ncbi:hypothetical protein C1645_835117 [Glomus cerebriforme]|uniref:MULE transposase domain-containing protein n=1 Tax=Glomus cerebriforme TaxID=658196 RepID=A0A397SAV8_9GLOM|nr:hypothetical protein C1645_835117 [Glomus cerebriforme]
MNPKPFVTNNNNNKQQYCSGCESNYPPSSFTANGNFYCTCNMCRHQNKEAYQQRLLYKQQNPDDQIIEFDNFHDFLADSFDNRENNEDQENKENLEFKFSCIVNINTLEGECDVKERASHIISVIIDVDKYAWEKSETFYYYCSQRDCLKQKSNKDSDNNKHHDKQSMERFACKGCVKITIYENSTFFNIEIYHVLHPIRPNFTISPAVKQFIINNIDLLPHEIYKRLVDREKWLLEKSYQIIFRKENPKALGFLTELWNTLKNSRSKIREIGIDATYFAQISAACFVWSGIKVQLCLWHVKKAIEVRLASNKKPQKINYNGIAAYQQFSFIDPLFCPSVTNE